MVKMVTGFEETFAAHAKEPATPDEDFKNLFEALKHDLEVAENVFARATKRNLKRLLKDRPLILQESKESRTERPLWMTEQSVTQDLTPQFLGDYVEILSAMTASMVRNIIDVLPEGHAIVLIDPVQTKIMQVGATEFTFRIKQKWGYRKATTDG
jgi:hypothetical protein